jgi:orotate phosphoribosyltransferase-like protein
MTFKQKYNQEFIDRVHSMKDNFEKSEIAKDLNVTVRTISYILNKIKPSIKVKYTKVEEATQEVDSIWNKVKKRFTFKLK